MRTLCLLLVICTEALAQVPPAPVNLRPLTALTTPPTDPTMVIVPVLATNGQFQAWYTWPVGTTNLWMPETSATGTNWMWVGEWAQLPERAVRQTGATNNYLPRMVQVETADWQVRLRRVRVPPTFPNIPIPY